MTASPLRLCAVPQQGLVYFAGQRAGRTLQPIADQLRAALVELLHTTTGATLAVPASAVVSAQIAPATNAGLVLSQLAAGVSDVLGRPTEFETVDPHSPGFLKFSVEDNPSLIGYRFVARLPDARSRQAWRTVLADMKWARVYPGAAFDAFHGNGGLIVSDATGRFNDADARAMMLQLSDRVQVVVDQLKTFPPAVVVPLLISDRLRYAA